MRLVHKARIKVFSYEKLNEDDSLILEKFQKLIPFNMEDENVPLNVTNAKGFNEKKIKIFEVLLVKEKHTTKFLVSLISKLDVEQKKLILSSLDKRLDENLYFYLRFSKDDYLKDDILAVTDSGDCFHIEMSIAAYPKKKQIAIDQLKSLFSVY